MCNYSKFYQFLSGDYMAFMNYIALLTFGRKILQLQFLKDCSMKTRPSKAKILIKKFIHITHSIIYHHQKAKKRFRDAKVIQGPKPPNFFNDRVLFRVFSDGVLFSILSDNVLIRSSLGSLLVGSSLMSL